MNDSWRVVALASVVVLLACDRQGASSGGQVSTPQQEAAQLLAQARKDVAAQQSKPEDSSPLYVPSGLEGKRPLLVFLHGLGGSGAGFVRNLRLEAWAQRKGFVLLAPEGDVDYSGRRYWNATASCCDFDGTGTNHVAKLSEWIDDALRLPVVDLARVYLIGFSNGGFLAHRAACELGGKLRGIFSIAGAAPGPEEGCPALRAPATKSLSVVQIHGRDDPIVRFDGGLLFADRRRPPHPSAEQSIAGWGQRNACTGDLMPRSSLELDPRVPGAETEVLTYDACEHGRVELWAIAGGDHSAGVSRFSLTAIWEFIEAQG